MRIFWNVQVIFWEIIIITVTEILCLKILTGKLIIKSEFNFFNLNWVISLKLCAVFIKMVWLTTFSTFIRTCWNSSSAKLTVRRLMSNGFQQFNSVRTSSRWSKGLLINSLMMLFTPDDVRCYIMVISIQLFIKSAELVKISVIIISNQMCFNQLTWKLSLKLANKQIQQLLRHIVKQGFNFVNQNCKLHSENRKLIIIFYAENLSFFHVSFALQVILIVFV